MKPNQVSNWWERRVRQVCLDEEQIEKIKICLQARLAPYLLVLFGSWAKGRARDDSDVDIAFLSAREASVYEIFMVGQELARIIGKDVDLLDLAQASTVMKAQIVTSGCVLYCSDEAQRMYFYMRALKEYALLNEERAPVLSEITRRGTIYGK